MFSFCKLILSNYLPVTEYLAVFRHFVGVSRTLLLTIARALLGQSILEYDIVNLGSPAVDRIISAFAIRRPLGLDEPFKQRSKSSEELIVFGERVRLYVSHLILTIRHRRIFTVIEFLNACSSPCIVNRVEVIVDDGCTERRVFINIAH